MKTIHTTSAYIAGLPSVPKPLVLLFLLVFSFTAQAQNKGYTVSGTVEGAAEGDTVYICDMQGFFALVPTDTTLIKDGRFSFTGSYDGAVIRYLLAMHNGENVGMTDFVLENSDITIRLSKDATRNEVTPGPNGKIMKELQAIEATYNDRMAAPWAIVQDSTATPQAKTEAQAQVDKIEDELKTARKAFVRSHVPSAFADMAYYYYQNDYTPEESEELLQLFAREQPQYHNYKAIMQERMASRATAVGRQYTNLAQESPDGKLIRVSDYVSRNRYVLIDFWASWCGPCRAEMPNVVKAYSAYHDKGFEVVGVSLDNNRAAWLKAIDQLHMPWPHMSDLKGWDSKAAAAYNVKAIPANVLINSKGEIIAKDLRGEELLNKLEQLFK